MQSSRGNFHFPSSYTVADHAIYLLRFKKQGTVTLSSFRSVTAELFRVCVVEPLPAFRITIVLQEQSAFGPRKTQCTEILCIFGKSYK